MNKDLYNKKFKVPQEIINVISQNLSKLNGQFINGVERANNIVNQKVVTYQQLKLIIHELKTMDKVKDVAKYNLMGGDLMNRWGNTYLNNQRLQLDNNKRSTKINSEIGGIDGVRKNSYNKKHTKKDSYKIAPNMLKTSSDKTSVSDLTASLKLFEEIDKIKKLM